MSCSARRTPADITPRWRDGSEWTISTLTLRGLIAMVRRVLAPQLPKAFVLLSAPGTARCATLFFAPGRTAPVAGSIDRALLARALAEAAKRQSQSYVWIARLSSFAGARRHFFVAAALCLRSYPVLESVTRCGFTNQRS